MTDSIYLSVERQSLGRGNTTFPGILVIVNMQRLIVIVNKQSLVYCCSCLFITCYYQLHKA